MLLLVILVLKAVNLFCRIRKTLLKQNSTTDKVNVPWHSTSYTDQTATTSDSSHYQEVRTKTRIEH